MKFVVLRIAAVGLVLLGVQRAVLADAPVRGVVLQSLLALAAAAGVAGGPERGALAGFVLGLMFDLSAATPLGLTALSYGLAGFTAGFALSVMVEPSWWVSMLFAVLGAAVGETAQPVLYNFIGDNGWLTTRLLWVVPICAGFAGLLSPIAVPIGRWCLGLRRPAWKAPLE